MPRTGRSPSRVLPAAAWQHLAVHFYRKVWSAVPTSKVKSLAAIVKAIHMSEELPMAQEKAALVVKKIESMKLGKSAEMVASGLEGILCYMAFPREHWRSLRTNNPRER